MNIKRKTNSKDLVTFILGEPPTLFQKIFVWLMILSFWLWLPVSAMSPFLLDAPSRSPADEICRLGLLLSIWLYPIYMFFLIRWSFRFFKKLRVTWLFYFCPLVPVALFYLFYTLTIIAYSDSKPDGCDFGTFERLNARYSLDVNHVYYDNMILSEADPSTFKVLSYDYATDMHHVWYNDIIIDGADPATFVVPDSKISNLAHDAHDYYMYDRPLYVANIGSFRQIDYNWALDSLNVYYLDYDVLADDTPVVGDYRTFKVLNEFYAVDSTCVYYKNTIVDGADPATFVVPKTE